MSEPSTHAPAPAEPAGFYVTRVNTPTATIAGIVALVIVAALFAGPFFLSRALMEQAVLLFVVIGLAQCWNLLAGYAGLISVGQQAFVGLGAYGLFYITAIMGIDPVLGIVISAAVTGLLAIPIGFVVFRLHGAYFAVVTWVVAEVLRILAARWQTMGGGTGRNLPNPVKREMFGVEWVADWFGVRSAEAQTIVIYWLGLIAAVVIVAVVYFLLRRRVGLGLTAVKDSEVAAEAVGVDIRRTKFIAYVFAAFGAAMVGGIYFLQNGNISPNAAFDLQRWTAFIIFIVVIGGMGTIEGPIVGGILYIVLQYFLADYSTWYLMGLGALAIFMMLVAPRGLWGIIADRFDIHLFPTRRRLVLDKTRQPPKG